MSENNNVINFDDGYKEFNINGDPLRVIRFNPNDIGIIERLNDAKNIVDEAIKNLGKDVEIKSDGTPVEGLESAAELIKSVRELIYEQTNRIFNNDVCDVIYGGQNPLASYKGVTLFERVMNAIGPIINKNVTREAAASEKRIKKYTESFVNNKKGKS